MKHGFQQCVHCSVCCFYRCILNEWGWILEYAFRSLKKNEPPPTSSLKISRGLTRSLPFTSLAPVVSSAHVAFKSRMALGTRMHHCFLYAFRYLHFVSQSIERKSLISRWACFFIHTYILYLGRFRKAAIGWCGHPKVQNNNYKIEIAT